MAVPARRGEGASIAGFGFGPAGPVDREARNRGAAWRPGPTCKVEAYRLHRPAGRRAVLGAAAAADGSITATGIDRLPVGEDAGLAGTAAASRCVLACATTARAIERWSTRSRRSVDPVIQIDRRLKVPPAIACSAACRRRRGNVETQPPAPGHHACNSYARALNAKVTEPRRQAADLFLEYTGACTSVINAGGAEPHYLRYAGEADGHARSAPRRCVEQVAVQVDEAGLGTAGRGDEDRRR